MTTLQNDADGELSPGTLVADRYRLTRRLGTGGMAQVFLAVDARIGREVAIKFMHRSGGDDLEKRFEKELTITGALTHPNVISIFDTGRFNNTAYFVMEYIDGSETMSTAVDRHLNSGSFVPLSVIREWFIQATRALKVLHDKHRAWHRDLKPDNLLVYTAAGDPYLKILDFGLVSAPSSSLTDFGTMLGTPAYMAPEWFQEDEAGEPLAPDHRADLFSLGLCLYVTLTGRHPYPELFCSNAKIAYMRALKIYEKGERARNPSERAHQTMPSDWARVVDRLLEKNRDKRFQSAAGLEKSLVALSVEDDWRTGKPLSASGGKPDVSRHPRRNQPTRAYTNPGKPSESLVSERNPDRLRAWSCDDHHCYANWRSVGISIWRGELLPSHVGQFEKRWGALAQSFEHIAVLTIVLPGAPPLKRNARQNMERAYKAVSSQLAGVCTCLEGGGVSASVGSMTMATLIMRVKPAYPIKVTESWVTGAEWLAGKLSEQPPKPTASALSQAVATMERRYRSHLRTRNLPYTRNGSDFRLEESER